MPCLASLTPFGSRYITVSILGGSAMPVNLWLFQKPALRSSMWVFEPSPEAFAALPGQG